MMIEESVAGARASRPQKFNKGWHSRGYLPHFDGPGEIQSLSFRLFDAVPIHLLRQWKRELSWQENLAPLDPRVRALRERIANYEDAGYGACFLGDARVADVVEDALLYLEGKRYRMLAWCVMPNHVHDLIETFPGFPLGEIVHSWKSFTSKKANRILGRSGIFWMPDYFDRYIRDEDHLNETVEYIERNPVVAGLVTNPGEWKWSSASRAGARASRPLSVPAGGTPALH